MTLILAAPGLWYFASIGEFGAAVVLLLFCWVLADLI
jgi:hypothetical protein